MATLVLTVIGDDRAGLVNALADVVSAHGGNWERSQLAELAGKFAGIVQSASPMTADELAAALEPLSGLLEVALHTGVRETVEAAQHIQSTWSATTTPGIVRDVSYALDPARDQHRAVDHRDPRGADGRMGCCSRRSDHRRAIAE